MTTNAIAILTAVAAVLAQVFTVMKLLSERAGRAAEVQRIIAQARATDKESDISGIRVVKEMSEATAVILAPLRSENRELWTRVDKMEAELDRLRGANRELTQELHDERANSTRERVQFETRMKALMAKHQADMERIKGIGGAS